MIRRFQLALTACLVFSKTPSIQCDRSGRSVIYTRGTLLRTRWRRRTSLPRGRMLSLSEPSTQEKNAPNAPHRGYRTYPDFACSGRSFLSTSAYWFRFHPTHNQYNVCHTVKPLTHRVSAVIRVGWYRERKGLGYGVTFGVNLQNTGLVCVDLAIMPHLCAQ